MEIDLAAALEPLAWQPAENGAHVLWCATAWTSSAAYGWSTALIPTA